MKRLTSFDTAAAKQVARLPTWLDKPFRYIAFIATPLAWLIILFAAAIIIRPQHLLPVALIMLAVPLASISKFLFRRNRPPTIYAGSMRIKSYSFPSSHAYASMLLCSFAASSLFAQGLLLLGALPLVYALIVGVSRVYLGAHYPSDVIGGWLLGAGVTAGVVLCA